jgi:hypothetical protein
MVIAITILGSYLLYAWGTPLAFDRVPLGVLRSLEWGAIAALIYRGVPDRKLGVGLPIALMFSPLFVKAYFDSFLFGSIEQVFLFSFFFTFQNRLPFFAWMAAVLLALPISPYFVIFPLVKGIQTRKGKYAGVFLISCAALVLLKFWNAIPGAVFQFSFQRGLELALPMQGWTGGLGVLTLLPFISAWIRSRQKSDTGYERQIVATAVLLVGFLVGPSLSSTGGGQAFFFLVVFTLLSACDWPPLEKKVQFAAYSALSLSLLFAFLGQSLVIYRDLGATWRVAAFVKEKIKMLDAQAQVYFSPNVGELPFSVSFPVYRLEELERARLQARASGVWILERRPTLSDGFYIAERISTCGNPVAKFLARCDESHDWIWVQYRGEPPEMRKARELEKKEKFIEAARLVDATVQMTGGAARNPALAFYGAYLAGKASNGKLMAALLEPLIPDFSDNGTIMYNAGLAQLALGNYSMALDRLKEGHALLKDDKILKFIETAKEGINKENEKEKKK